MNNKYCLQNKHIVRGDLHVSNDHFYGKCQECGKMYETIFHYDNKSTSLLAVRITYYEI